MPAMKWTRTATLRAKIEAAAEDTAKISALLLAMAAIVAPDDEDFAEELRDAARGESLSSMLSEDADYWLAQLYEWADTMRVWID